MAKTFAQWMGQVNKLLIQMCGMSSECIADYCYRSAFDCGDTPEEAAQDALENATNS